MTYDFVSCNYPLNMELFLTDATDPLSLHLVDTKIYKAVKKNICNSEA
jgi:hypothetical protein